VSVFQTTLTRAGGKDVLTVDDYGAIRRAYRDGMPIKRIAREFHHSRNTVRKILRSSEPNPIPGSRPLECEWTS
jgi:DNA invertase Pin-like site-specific DNA recombinase